MTCTKIVATIGPASESPGQIQSLFAAGVDVFRLNMSHGTHERHAEVIKSIREAAAESSRTAGILCDLSGPKIRIGQMAGGPVELVPGNTIVITSQPVPGTASLVSTNYSGLPRDVKPGRRILLDDGLLEFEVTDVSGDKVTCRIIRGGWLSSHKGLNLPGTRLAVPSLTEKDKGDMEFGIRQGVDLFALSFVRSPEDLDDARSLMKGFGADLPLIAKIEKSEAVEALDEIVERSDGCMVARGDLGVEIPIEQVPIVQKRLIRLCNMAAKPVITATQMLDSMLRSPRPTRAEASDVANAILDGSDAVMLSGETAVGPYARQAVETMDRIAAETETILDHRLWLTQTGTATDIGIGGAISHAAAAMAQHLKAQHILCITVDGSTPRAISRYRPASGVLAYTNSRKLANQLCASWGVRAIAAESPTEEMRKSREDSELLLREAVAAFERSGVVSKGDTIVVATGSPLTAGSTTNVLRVVQA